MAKRFTDTGKWDDPWFQDLPSKYKLFWIYILDKCNHAGIWEVNFKNAAYFMGEHLEVSEVKRIFTDRIHYLNDQYWHLVKFIPFQYGGIKNDSVGKSVQKILKRHNLIGANEGLLSPLAGTKDKDKDMVKDKDYIEVEEKIIFDPMPILDFYQAQLNGMQKEHNNRAWRPLVQVWFKEHLQESFKDNMHVKNSFKRFYIAGPAKKLKHKIDPYSMKPL